MSIVACFEERPERRGAARRVMRLDIEPGAQLPVGVEIKVLDLSLTGGLFETSRGFALPDVFDVQLPDNTTAKATVVWNSSNLYGCQFSKRLSSAALSAAMLRSAPERGNSQSRTDNLVRRLQEVREQVEGLVDQVDRAIESLRKK